MHAISEPPPVDFALVLHFHQPVGNFDDVIRQVTESCYRPLLEILHRHERVKVHLHVNGILLEWFQRQAPDLLVLIREQVERGSCELLTGGHQEPILSILPEEDAVGQIHALSEELNRRFEATPAGLWLTERVWEPRLPAPLHRAGVRYTVLDDTILRSAGVEADGCLGYWLTEDHGHPLALFPGLKSLRYLVPFRPVEETVTLLAGLRRPDGGRPLVTYADDAEKFGAWPQTYEWVFTRGWLARFLEMLGEKPWIRTVHLTPYLDDNLPQGRVYPPTSSYPEMTVWALPTPARRRLETVLERLEKSDEAGALEFVRGSHWRGFLAKYPEADRLHKRMLEVSRRLRERRATADHPRLAQVTRDLYRGQCNDAYWHGSFGGLYLVHLRRAVERHLIRAERTLDELDTGSAGATDVIHRDLDADGREEVKIRSPHSVVIVDPDDGGALLAWDLRRSCDNLVGVMQRHEESFHQALLAGTREMSPGVDGEGDEGIETIHGAIRVKPGVGPEDLKIDHHPRLAWMEWRGPADLPWASPEAFTDGATFLGGRWSLDGAEASGRVVLSHRCDACRIVKSLEPGREEASLSIRYQVESPADAAPWRLATEWNLLVGYTGDDLELETAGGWSPAPAGSRDHVDSLVFRGGGERGLRLECSPAATVSWATIHTVSSSEAGLEKTGQGTVFLVGWSIRGRLEARLRWIPTAPEWPDESTS